MSPTIDSDIAIIGGGMVGAALAALLAKADPRWRIAVIEAFPLLPDQSPTSYRPSFDDRSTAIAHGSVLLLQQLGLWDSLRQYATPIEQVHVSDRGHLNGALIDRHQVGVDALGYVIPNAWIGQVLLAHLQGLDNLDWLAPARVSRLKPVAGGAELTVVSGNSSASDGAGSVVHRTSLAVIADGAQSSLRDSLGIDVAVQAYGQSAVITNVNLDEPHQGIAYERFTDLGPMAMLPLGGSQAGRQAALVWTLPESEVDAVMALSDEAFLQRLQLRFGFRLGRLTGIGKRDSYPLSLAVAKEQVRSSLVVMGNAAHFLHPVAGQGFNLALRDCAALAATLQQAAREQQPLGKLSVLQQYLQVQAQDQQLTIGISDQLTKWFSHPGLPQAALRALGFIGLECVPPAKQWLSQQTMGNISRQVVL